MKGVHQLLDLPDELILAIMKKVDPQVLFLCSMIDIGNYRLEQLAFDRCHTIDLTFDCFRAARQSHMKKFYSHVMPRIGHDIRSLTIHLRHISPIRTFVENNCNGTLPNLTHLKILLGVQHAKTGVPYTIGNL
jgi:hypothetical protein